VIKVQAVFVGKLRAPRIPVGNGGSHPREGCTVFPRALSPLSRRVLSVQRPDSIDPHLLAFVFRSALWNTSLPRRKEIPRTRKRGSRKPGTMDSTGSPSEGARRVSDDSRVYSGKPSTDCSKVSPKKDSSGGMCEAPTNWSRN
jgi:hypothetical protein